MTVKDRYKCVAGRQFPHPDGPVLRAGEYLLVTDVDRENRAPMSSELQYTPVANAPLPNGDLCFRRTRDDQAATACVRYSIDRAFVTDVCRKWIVEFAE